MSSLFSNFLRGTAGSGASGGGIVPGRSFNAFGRDFHAEKVLGEGAFAKVYLVRGSDGAQYALKVASMVSDTWPIVQAEVVAMSRCKHPNLLRLHDVEFRSLQGQNMHLTIDTAGESPRPHRCADSNLTAHSLMSCPWHFPQLPRPSPRRACPAHARQRST